MRHHHWPRWLALGLLIAVCIVLGGCGHGDPTEVAMGTNPVAMPDRTKTAVACTAPGAVQYGSVDRSYEQ